MLYTLIILCFVLGYSAIAFEQHLRVHKSASALLAGVVTWVLLISFSVDKEQIGPVLLGKLGNISGILFFLIGALTIVQLIDAHDGFSVISERMTTNNHRKLLWILSFLTFFLSALLDNMTTAIVMVSLVRRLIHDQKEKWIFAGMIVIAANAGGAWSPIGDVTTTMLWIGNQITAINIVLKLFIPAVFSVIIPLLICILMIKHKPAGIKKPEISGFKTTRFERVFVFYAGIFGLLSIPVFTALTKLPPYMGMLFSLGLIWTMTEIIHRKKPENEKGYLSVTRALKNTDIPTILFFLGILLCIAAMETAGLLSKFADFMTVTVRNQSLTGVILGLFSSVVDNVPLLAAVQGMYPLSVFPTDHYFWELIAFTLGTGGSILIIGSAAGVAVMGMENISFFWYLRKISLPALAGYFAGALVYLLQIHFIG
ncbi:MAG: sodium:proton antiporter NhaD [Bacteroidetes bacterium]|nr:sodium:proton antiporter NhaD [Bacteroidota bacterium]